MVSVRDAGSGDEGLGIGLLGAATGAGAGLGIVAGLTGHLADPVVAACGSTAAAGVLVATLAAVVPAVTLRRLPTGTLLAEE